MSEFLFLKRPYYIYLLLITPLVLNLYWQYEQENLASSIFAGFCIGTLLNSWFFANLQNKLYEKTNEQMTKLTMENVDLQHELFIAKMPHSVKKSDPKIPIID